MKFLVDMPVSPQIARWLIEKAMMLFTPQISVSIKQKTKILLMKQENRKG